MSYILPMVDRLPFFRPRQGRPLLLPSFAPRARHRLLLGLAGAFLAGPALAQVLVLVLVVGHG